MCRGSRRRSTPGRDDPAVALLVIDAAGDKAFCAGGDIAEMYETGTRGRLRLWPPLLGRRIPDERQAVQFPKPVVSFLQGFTMGGGVGVGCHASHRIVGDTSRIAMPECGIGLVPDVGGSLILARAPGRLGEYLGVTGGADGTGRRDLRGLRRSLFVPRGAWPALHRRCGETGDWEAVDRACPPPPRRRWPRCRTRSTRVSPGDPARSCALAGAEGAISPTARAPRWRATARCRWPARWT
jgi:enoyl-CoA hydratase